LSNRFEEAFELANRAVMVHPNSVFVRHRAAAAYAVCGESDKAVAQCEAACRMNPLDGNKTATATYSVLSCAHYLARRYEESVQAGRRALVFAPQANIARKYVAISLAQLGRTDEARARSLSSSSTSPTLRLHASSIKVLCEFFHAPGPCPQGCNDESPPPIHHKAGLRGN
jgi:adenylate cyclase